MTMHDVITEGILTGLEPLFEEARRTGKGFYVSSLCVDPTWFSPRELMEEQKGGHYVWGAVNWRLRDPQEMIDAARLKCLKAEDELAWLKARVKREKEMES